MEHHNTTAASANSDHDANDDDEIIVVESGSVFVTSTSHSSFLFGQRLGVGSYGVVYAAKHVRRGVVNVAIKRNMVASHVCGTGNARELDFFARVGNHPHIAEVLGVLCTKNGFPDDNISKHFDPREYNTDSIHIVMHRETTALDHVIRRQRRTTVAGFTAIKTIMVQILVACEWIHAHGVVHRDLKPSNVLVSLVDGHPVAKLCDFGMAGSMCGNRLTTPGVVTIWYRAPEICGKHEYGTASDIWSVGAILFEMVSGRSLFSSTRDESGRALLLGILRRLPSCADSESYARIVANDTDRTYVETRLSKHQRDVIHDANLAGDDRIGRTACMLREAMHLTPREVEAFDAAPGGSLDMFCDLLSELLIFNPDARLSASDALDHPFFCDNLESDIANLRGQHPPVPRALPAIAIAGGHASRDAAMALAVRIFNNRASMPWYTHRILFHAIDLFERYLVARAPGVAPLSPHETWIRMYIAFYLFHKVFNSVECISEWEAFAPAEYQSASMVRSAEAFELKLIRDVCRFAVYRDTIFEVAVNFDGRVSETRVREMLIRLREMNAPWSGGSVRALFRTLFPEHQQHNDASSSSTIGSTGPAAPSPIAPHPHPSSMPPQPPPHPASLANSPSIISTTAAAASISNNTSSSPPATPPLSGRRRRRRKDTSATAAAARDFGSLGGGHS